MLKKYKTKRMIEEHPEIFDHNKEKTFTILDSDIPDIQWFFEKNSFRLSHHSNRSTKPWYVSKRILIPICTILVLGVFLGTTTEGRALVERVYKTVAEFFDQGVRVKHGVDEMKPDPEILAYHSIEEVNTQYDIHAAKANAGSLEKIEVSATEFYVSIDSIYVLDDEEYVTISQVIYFYDTEVSATAEYVDDQTFIVKSLDGIDIIGYINDEMSYAKAYKDNNMISVYSYNVSYDSFIDFLQSIQFV